MDGGGFHRLVFHHGTTSHFCCANYLSLGGLAAWLSGTIGNGYSFFFSLMCHGIILLLCIANIS